MPSLSFLNVWMLLPNTKMIFFSFHTASNTVFESSAQLSLIMISLITVHFHHALDWSSSVLHRAQAGIKFYIHFS